MVAVLIDVTIMYVHNNLKDILGCFVQTAEPVI